MLLEAQGVSRNFGAFRALDGADLGVEDGELVGLIGPNGAGKSTFFNCIAGDLLPSAGRVRFAGRDVTRAPPELHARLGIGRTFQVPATFEDMSVLENVMVGAFLRHPGRAAAIAAAREVIERVGLAEQRDAPARSLGTPGRKRLEIARVLATAPRLLLLDEALAGLNPTEIGRAIELVRQIHQSGVTIVIVEHIMEVILSLAQRVVVFDHGRIIAAGRPAEVVEEPAVIEAYLGHSLKRRAP
ncbi:MAG TPA: ABC transporter ATP-binding protein [Stellaceae bacterium]|nr:ABC transporter ATP-binding protein [Stellaceae bacterium]